MILRREVQVKDLFQVLGRYADARVLDPNLDAVAAAGAQTSRSVPPLGIAWQPLIARLRNAWRSIDASPLTGGSDAGTSTTTLTLLACASGSIDAA